MVKFKTAIKKTLGLLLGLLAILDLSAQNPCDQLGFSNGWMLNMDDEEVDEITSACALTGALYFRSDIAWTDVQFNGPSYWNWDNVDRVVLSAKSQGLETIGILDYFPPWADPTTDTTFWSTFVYQAGIRYIPQGITVWELWNEPNITNFWPQPNVEEYVNQVLIPGSNAIRKAANELDVPITVLTAGLAPAATDGTNISQEDFLLGIYDMDASGYFDAVGHHPYCWPLDPSIPDPFNWFLKTEDLYDIMVENGDGNKKIWCTELGWPTISNSNFTITGVQQADYLSKASKLWKEWEFTGPLLWYAYKDAGSDQSDPEDNFGIVDNNFYPKLALITFLNLVENCSMDTTTNIDIPLTESTPIIYPNPSTRYIKISNLSGRSSIRLLNMMGEELHTLNTDSNSTAINLAGISSGLLLIEIRNHKNEFVALEKIVKTN